MKAWGFLLCGFLAQNVSAQELSWVRDNRVLNPSGVLCSGTPRMDLGDIDGDGYLDLILLEYEGLQFYRNLGVSETIQFERRSDWEVGIDLETPSYALVPTLVDLDGDDRAELIIPESSMHVWKKTANDGWTRMDTLLAGVQGSRYIAAADLDSDDDLDLVTLNANNLWVYWNIGTKQSPAWQGDPNAIDRNNVATEAGRSDLDNVRLADIDADGDADFLTTIEIPISYGQVVILENFMRDSLRFRRINLESALGKDKLYYIAAGDVDNDGDLDLLTGAFQYLSFWGNIGHSQQMILAEEVLWGTPKHYLEGDVAIVDIDDDSDRDLLLVGSAPPTDITPAFIQLLVYENLGNPSSFYWTQREERMSFEFQRLQPTLQVADFYRNGSRDLVIGLKLLDEESHLFDYQVVGSTIVYYREHDDGEPDNLVFAQFSNDSIYYDPSLFDFNDDTRLDLLVQVDGEYRFFENIGTIGEPNWQARPDWLDGLEEPRHHRAEPGDVNNDGLPDLVFGEWDGTLKFYENVGTPSIPRWHFVREAFAGVAVDSGAAPALGDLDGDGDLDLVVDDAGGTTAYYRNEIIVAVKSERSSDPQSFFLHQNYPNPFNPETTIEYELTQAGRVRLTIYNLRGQRVRTLVVTWQQSGAYKVTWDGTNSLGHILGSGIYFYEIAIDGAAKERKKMIVVR